VTTKSAIPTATEALQAFARRALRPSTLTEQILDRIAARDPALGAYVEVDAQGARRAARAADAAWDRGTAGPLCGLPISVKDIYDLRDHGAAGCGNPELTGRRGPVAQDAEAVEQLRSLGAVILGRTHLHELALGITGVNPALGTPRNPHDPTRLPGGSSSGSAVSVAAGLAVASLGTDTGGSVRVPAALCGLVGLKPTFGWIGRRGLRPLAPSMDHVGLLGRTVSDVALIYRALRDRVEPEELGRRRAAPPLRAGLVEELFRAADGSVQSALGATLGRLTPEAVEVEAVSLRGLEQAVQTYGVIVRYEAARVHAQRPASLGADVRRMLEAGAALSSEEYTEALDRRARFTARCGALLRRYDCLLSPTTRVVAPPLDASSVELDGVSVPVREALIGCTCLFSMAGLPALSVPAGVAGGLPVGLQVVGAPWDEAAVLAVGAALGGAVG